jgi:hypothetical protein
MDTSSPTSATYLLLFRNTGPEVFAHLNSEQKQRLVSQWNDWYDKLARQGKALEGQPLEAKTRVVTGSAGARVTDGPFPEAKEAVGGYVKVLADSFEEATKIAQQHPALAHGMLIEVRQLIGNCHLGVVGGHGAKVLTEA